MSVHPTHGVEIFRQYFFAILYLSHLLTFTQNVMEIVTDLTPSVEGVKRKRGRLIKIEGRHVWVSQLLMSFLF